MKEVLYTIPLTDAIEKNDECPFCIVYRKLEQDNLDFILGASYMESDFREKTDKDGFCRYHFKMMYDYGNNLGNAWILSSHLKRLHKDLTECMNTYKPDKSTAFGKWRKKRDGGEGEYNQVCKQIHKEEKTCYLCSIIEKTFARYMDTFCFLIKKDESFRNLLRNSKGFCMHHFGILMENLDLNLNNMEKEELYPMLFQLMENNLKRIHEDILWLIEKHDYRNKDADWKNSKDAVPRAMQKIAGSYPSDSPYVNKK